MREYVNRVMALISRTDLMAVGGGGIVSVISGAVSLGIIVLIDWTRGSDAAAFYVYVATVVTMAGTALSLGIPEYGQIIGAKRKKSTVGIPIGLLVLVLMGLVWYFSLVGGLTGMLRLGLSGGLVVVALAAVGLIITGLELWFRYNLLRSKSVVNYIVQNAMTILLCVALFVALKGHNLEKILGIVLMAGMVIAVLMMVGALPLGYQMTFIGIDGDQLGFYAQRLLLVFIDTSLMLSAHGVMIGKDYVVMGVLSRLLTPVFIFLNVYVSQDRAKLLMHEAGAGKKNWHRNSLIMLVLVGFCVRLLGGQESVWGLFWPVLMVRFWVLSLVVELQEYLPKAPVLISLASFVIWAVGVYLIAHGFYYLLDVILALVVANMIVVRLWRPSCQWQALG